jgi:hypothetical protein
MGQKDRLLKDLSDGELHRLLQSASRTVDKSANKVDLIDLAKESFSVEELKQKIKEIKITPFPGQLDRKTLFLGGIGQAFLTAWGFASALIYISYSFFFPQVFGAASIQTLTIWSMIGTVFFFIFAILNLTSMVLIRGRLKGNRIGVVSATIALVTSVVGILYYIFSYIGLTYDTIHSPYGDYVAINGLGIAVPFVYNLLLAATMILIGVFFFFRCECFSSIGLSILAGLLYVLAGAFLLNYTPPQFFSLSIAFVSSVFFVSSPLSIAAGVVGASCFFSTRSTE